MNAVCNYVNMYSVGPPYGRLAVALADNSPVIWAHNNTKTLPEDTFGET